MRFVFEFEIEVTDPTAAAAYTFDWTRDEDGNEMMMSHPSAEHLMTNAVAQAFMQSMSAVQSSAGFKVVGMGPQSRSTDGNGYYEEVTLPKVPVRGSDGKWVAEPLA